MTSAFHYTQWLCIRQLISINIIIRKQRAAEYRCPLGRLHFRQQVFNTIGLFPRQIEFRPAEVTV